MKLPRTNFEFKEYCRRVIAYAASASIVLTPAMGSSLPQGGIVSAGQATIADGLGRVDIHQTTDKAVIDWRGFDVDSQESVEFHQPGNNSLAVNRVNSDSPSIINGNLKANGNVMVINPNGMLFGGKANVDVNGIVASTADGDNASLMKGGKLSLSKPGNPNAAIVNQGRIKAKDGGSVGIIAPNISNQGIIEARLGKVQLASGDTATVDLYGDGLIEAAVSDKVKSQLIENSGIISAGGGSIAITAAAGDQIVDSLINLGGLLDARSVGSKSGKITVRGDGSNAVKGNKTPDKGKKSGSSNVLVSGILDASGRNAGERGGFIQVLGDNIALLADSFIDASGHTGLIGTTDGKPISSVREGSAGGDIRIGGDYLGLGDTPTANNLYVDPGAFILNDSIHSGDAGRTIFWSDGTTEFYGNVFARALGGLGVDPVTGSAIAGGNAGDGGFVETSGHKQLDAGGYVDLTSSNGNRGTYFLDPADITIYGNVDPAFQSTDGTINLASSLKLWLDASDTSKVNLTYNALGATATGTTGSNTITVSSNTGLVVGSRIRLGGAGAATAASTVGADTYTITGIAGTTITLSSNLTTNYNVGAGNDTLFQGYVSQINDKSGQNNHATQATPANMPLWISNGQNGVGIIRFSGTSGTLLAGAYSTPLVAGPLSYFTAAQPLGTSGTSIDGVITSTYSGIYFDGTRFVTNGDAANDLNSSNTPIGVTGYNLIGSTYITNNTSGSSMFLNGALAENYLGVGSIPFADTNLYELGGRTSGGFPLRVFNGNIGDATVYMATLNTNARNLVEQYQSAKWGIALDPIAGAGTEVAEATGATGYSVFSTRYLERLSQTANVSLQATNNITLDLKTDTLALANNRNLTLTAGNQINTASAGTITTTGTGTINFNAADYNQLHALNLNGAGGTTITADTINLGGTLTGAGTLTLRPASNATITRINHGAGDFNLDATEIGNIQNGWNNIVIGRDMSITQGAMHIGPTTWQDPVLFTNGTGQGLNGAIVGTDNATITMSQSWPNALASFNTGSSINADAGITIGNAWGPINVQSSQGNINFNGFYGAADASMTATALNGTVYFANFRNGSATVNANSIGFDLNGNFTSTINGGIGNLNLTATNSITFPTINASSILARATGATSDITIPVGKTLTASGAGNAITLAAGRNIINNAGAGALSTPSGRWLLYMGALDGNTFGGLTSGFLRYGCPYATCGIPTTGNGFLYASQPPSSGGGGGGSSIPFSEPVIEGIPIIPEVVTPSTPPTTGSPIAIGSPTPSIPAPGPVAQVADSGLPITVQRISIDPSPILVDAGGRATAISNFITVTSGDEVPQNEDTSSTTQETRANADNDPQNEHNADKRTVSMWDGMLTITPELARRLDLDPQHWQ